MDYPKNIEEKQKEIALKNQKLQDELPAVFSSYYRYLKRDKAPLTVHNYLSDLKQFFSYLTGAGGKFDGENPRNISEQQIREVTSEDINAYLEYAETHEEEGKAVTNKRNTIARKRTSLTGLFSYLYRNNMIEEDISGRVDPVNRVRQKDRVIKYLEEHEIMDMLDAVEQGKGLSEKEKKIWEKHKYRDTAIITLFLVCALRQSELQQLNLSSFDWDREEFIVYRKRDKEKTMPMNGRVKRAVSDYINKERPKVDDDALFLSNQKKRISGRQLINIVKKYTGVALHSKGYSPHKLRATAATSLIRRGESIYDVRDYLDHESVATTQIYAQNRENVKRDLSKKMEFDENE